MPRIVHFEIPADDTGRAVDFYQKVFDWKIEKWDGPVDYWLVTTGEEDEPGINGAITERANLGVTVNTIDIPSLDESIAKVEAAGGKVVLSKVSVPGVGYMAYCSDSEGNVFGMMESDESAE
jgi:hypothetical protein